RGALHLSEEFEPIVLLPLGYPADNYEADPRNSKRKPLHEIAEWV
ncbi:MAG: nitroreductase, partial [Bacteroidales bacterium]|nr:nitroreductase [Bacteroidales bacterium]